MCRNKGFDEGYKNILLRRLGQHIFCKLYILRCRKLYLLTAGRWRCCSTTFFFSKNQPAGGGYDEHVGGASVLLLIFNVLPSLSHFLYLFKACKVFLRRINKIIKRQPKTCSKTIGNPYQSAVLSHHHQHT